MHSKPALQDELLGVGLALWEFLEVLVLISVNQCYDNIVRPDTRDDMLKSSSFHFHHSLWMSFLRPGSPRTSVMKLEDDEVKSLGHEMSALDRVNVYKYSKWPQWDRTSRNTSKHLAERRMEERTCI